MAGPIGLEIVDFVDYSALQRQVFSVITQVLKKPKLQFEDKLIVENALNLWVGCLEHKEELFKEFMNQNYEEFILAGLLYSPYETISE